MISLNTRKPADLLALHGGSIVDYVCDEPCPIEKPSRIKVTSTEPASSLNAKYSDIDINGHVNISSDFFPWTGIQIPIHGGLLGLLEISPTIFITLILKVLLIYGGIQTTNIPKHGLWHRYRQQPVRPLSM